MNQTSKAPTCWWCAQEGQLTAEHAVKAADLKARFGDLWDQSSAPRVITKGNQLSRRLQGPNSRLAKFKPSLCHACNTTRSQPFDRAYDVLSNYLLGNHSQIRQTMTLRFDRIYGAAFYQPVADMLGYCMKIFGCSLIDEGHHPGLEFISRIGKHNVAPFGVTISVNRTVMERLNNQVLSPLTTEVRADGTYNGVMFNGIFEFRMYWKIRPLASQSSTLIYRPMKKVVMAERQWGQNVHWRPRR